MTALTDEILDNLRAVAAERQRRHADAELAAGVDAVKQLQHRRFELSYSDLLAQTRYEAAVRFFLDDLYGPHDFAQRDAEFVRVVPALVRLFPAEVVTTVRALSELHALSESLDSQMARACAGLAVSAQRYARAWQSCGSAAERDRQIVLTSEVGQSLDRYTGNFLLGRSLRMMRGPARAAGLGELQAFLETGFDTFRAMRGATEFMNTITQRERQLAAQLFAVDPATLPATVDLQQAAQALAALGEPP